MKKSNLIITGAAALVALVAVTGVVASSYAFGGNFGMPGAGRGNMAPKNEEFRADMEARREAVDSAIGANDYDAWVKAVGENAPILEKINKDNFSKFVEAHNLMNQARDIMKELGVERGPMMGSGRGMDFRGHR